MFFFYSLCELAFSDSFDKCSPGIRLIEYKDEFFKKERENRTLLSVNLTGFKYNYDSLRAIGSFCPPKSGKYQFKVKGKMHSNLIFNGNESNKLGMAGACYIKEGDEHDTPIFQLYSNRCYSFEAKERTGCGLYKQRFQIYSKFEDNDWEVATGFKDCDYQGCIPNHYGETCQDVCPKCPVNSYCDEGVNGTGKCICNEGWYGEQCSDKCLNDDHCGLNEFCDGGQCVCKEDFYGEKCQKYCDRYGTCSGHGSCNSEGQCICDSTYDGEICDHKEGEIHPLINDTLPDGCEEGLTIERFGNEFFSSRKEKYVSNKFSIDSMKYTYSSYIASGSFCPPRSGHYQFKLEGKSYVELTFNGKTVHKIGPGGACLPKKSDSQTTEVYELSYHRCYPIIAKLRTGCGLYNQWVHLYVSENGGEWVLADNFITCQHNNCLPNYFGPTCSGICTVNCSGHGTCSEGVEGTGMCICEDGYLSPNCAQKYVPPKIKCNKGMKMTVYSDEIGFKNKISEEQVYDSSINVVKTYNAITVEGSIIPPVKGDYQLKLRVKPTGEMDFMNEKIGKMGLAGICLEGTSVEGNSTVMRLRPNTTYPLSIKMRTGCATIKSKYITLQWKNGPKYSGDIEAAKWEDIPPDYLFDCTTYDCADGLYGEKCDQECPECGENQYCSEGINGTGKCICKQGWYGENCTDKCAVDSHCGLNQKCFNGQCICAPDYYGDECTSFCSRNNTCNSHGTCDENGQCVCDERYSGEFCERKDGEIPPSYEGLPEQCQTGLEITRYGDEFFNKQKESWLSSYLNIESMKRTYNSYKAFGTFCPNVSGKYKFKLDGKAYVDLFFDGKQYGKIGPGGSCLPHIQRTEETEELELDANRCYRIVARSRTGCGLYKQWLKLFVSFNSGEYEIANLRFYSCDYQGCLPGYYGDHCQYKCESDCSGHGHCFDGLNGNGKCICNDGYALPTCRYKESLPKPRCSSGVNVKAFSNEITFGDEKENFFIENISYNEEKSFYGYTFDSAIMPPHSGEYQVRMLAKPYAQMSFKSETKPEKIGAAGSCLNTITTNEESSVWKLNENTVYPISLKMRTGCTLYTKYMHVQWKNGPKYYGIDNAPWEDIPKDYLFNCGSEDCVEGFYGAKCQDKCGKCPENAYCNEGIKGNGTCLCKEGWYGPNCTDQCLVDAHCGENEQCDNGKCVCAEDYFGEKCTKFCSRYATCGGHGSCNNEGMCICDEEYSGFDCTEHGNETVVINDTLPVGAEYGLVVQHFKDESFNKLKESWVTQSVDLDMREAYDSYRVTGSFCPNESGKYRFRVEGKSYISFKFDGEEYDKSTMYLASCLPSIKETKETTDLYLDAHKCYPIEIKLITGCKLYSQYLKFYMKVKENNWQLAKNMITLQYQDCLPNYFGSKCENRITINCGDNGRPNSGIHGNGLCICNDGYLGPDCRRKQQIGEPKCPPGVNLTVYKDEIKFKNVESQSVNESFEYPSLHYTYRALTFIGSFIPPQEGDYQLRMTAKPRGQIEFFGIKKPAIIGGAGCCDNIAKNDESTPVYHLYSNITYPIKVNMQTGCSIISKRMSVQWKNGPKYYGIENAPWEKIPTQNIFACDKVDCVKGYYGEKCQDKCRKCPQHSSCDDGINGTGKCKCDPGFFGENCDKECLTDSQCGNNQMCSKDNKCICKKDFYGSDCSAFCVPSLNCSNHGSCNSEGKCSCNTPWTGDDCSVKIPDRTPSMTSTGESQGGGDAEADQKSKKVFTRNIIILVSVIALCIVIIVVVVIVKKKNKENNVLSRNNELLQSLATGSENFSEYLTNV